MFKNSKQFQVSSILIILLLVSIVLLPVFFVGLSFKWQYGLLGFLISIGGLLTSISGLSFAYKIGNELDMQTVGQVAEKMTREYYLKSRRNPKTFNKSEIEKILTYWLTEDFGLDKSKLTREAKFVIWQRKKAI